MLVRVVCSYTRHLGYPRSRPLALNQLLAFWRCCNNEAWLQGLVRGRGLARCWGGVNVYLPTCTEKGWLASEFRRAWGMSLGHGQL